jgi:hypothetical protein
MMQLQQFVRSLPADEFYVDGSAAQEALAHEGQFNVIDLANGWKVDLIMRKSRPFSRTEFGRRLPVEAWGVALSVATRRHHRGKTGMGQARRLRAADRGCRIVAATPW